MNAQKLIMMLALALALALVGCGDAAEAPAGASLFERELCERNRSAYPDDDRTPSLTEASHVCDGGTYRWEWMPDPEADHGGVFAPLDVCDPGNVECADYWCVRPCEDLGLDR